MKLIELGEVSKLVMGQAPPGKDCNQDGNGVPFVKAGQFGGLYPSIDEWTQKPLKMAQIDDVLVCVVGATSGKINLGADCAIGRSVAAVRPAPKKLDQKYLYYFLSTWTRRLRSGSQGSAQGVITKRMLEELIIPLPPLEEQKRIAAILDKADAIRRKRKEAIALTEELLRSTFLDMFGDPVTNPKGWKIVAMSDAISQIEAGWSAKGEERQCGIDEWGVLKISAVTSGVFYPQEHKAVDNPNFGKKLIVPKRGDLLFSRANTRELVAATCLVENDCERLFLPDKLWRIKTNSNIANVEYIRFLLADPKYRSLLARQATGTSGSMLNVSQAKLLKMYAPIPELSIQEKFAAAVWRIYKLKERNKTSLYKLNLNFNSLLQKAFRGEL